MAVRPPADAVVALRSLDRRFRSILAGRDEDESPDEMAHRPGPGGSSAVDYLVASTAALSEASDALGRILREDEPLLDVRTPDLRGPRLPGGSVEEHLADLAAAAGSLADAAATVKASDWARTGRRGSSEGVSASGVLWEAVDIAVAHLKSADRTLSEVRHMLGS